MEIGDSQIIIFIFLGLLLMFAILIKRQAEKKYLTDIFARMKYGYTRIDPRDMEPMGAIKAFEDYRDEMTELGVEIEYHIIEKLVEEELEQIREKSLEHISIPLDVNYDEIASAPDLDNLLRQRDEWVTENLDVYTELAEVVSESTLGHGVMVVENTDDNEIVERVQREGGDEGDVQITLAWDDYNDLDLHVYTPKKERIFFNKKKSSCGGELDVDMNVKPESKTPVENVVWKNSPPKGKYKVVVHFYRHHKKGGTKKESRYRLRVSIKGVVREYTGIIKKRQRMQVITSFTIK